MNGSKLYRSRRGRRRAAVETVAAPQVFTTEEGYAPSLDELRALWALREARKLVGKTTSGMFSSTGPSPDSLLEVAGWIEDANWRTELNRTPPLLPTFPWDDPTVEWEPEVES